MLKQINVGETRTAVSGGAEGTQLKDELRAMGKLEREALLKEALGKEFKIAIPYCPFRGCTGDWVKLGVAKRHGAVLGDPVSKMADKNTKVHLVESDIPGAELPKPAEFCTVAILKRWLSCRGAKVSGNRKDLIKRLDYEPCNVNYFETIVTFAIEVNSLQTAVESFIF